MSRTAADIRREFLEFFRARQHALVPPSPVVPHDDPTLLFTNAGMNQFKPLFLGAADRSSEFGRLRRAANSQPCIRAGGKHNDLDDVGHDTYHHTFFEMLGNWSFGDYFKDEAIAWAWELITQVWKLDPDRLHATYFGGDEAENLPPDDEARDLWRRFLPPERIHSGSKKDNFWEMGDTGPCGPCSEMHIDLTPDKSGGRLVNAGDERVIEFWNLVFIQFNRGPDGRLTPLPARHVDTGMGFERITRLIQGKRSNYDIDVFTPIFEAIRRVSGAAAYESAVVETHPRVDTEERDVAYRVIADHIRTLVFALADGAVPDKEGRGYVLRRILRRAVRYGWQYLDLHKPFMCDLVDTVVATMGGAFPKLREDPRRIVALIRDEEVSFERTLARGMALFEEAAERARRHHNEIHGEDAFKLHDTFGFPIDLTQIMANEKGLRVDIGEYERLMEVARERAREGGRTEAAEVDALPPEALRAAGATSDAFKFTHDALEAQVTGLFRLEQDGSGTAPPPAGSLHQGQRGVLVLDRTCFYAEQGGQVGDAGLILTSPHEPESEDVFQVEQTVRIGEAVAHVGRVRRGGFDMGEPVFLKVDARRRATMQNHTATHVLNWALREVLGEHVQQKGSLVDPEKTRFDFSHPRAIAPEELERIERLCLEQIRQGLDVDTNDNAPVSQQEALRINGLRAVFGEKYPDLVRVVSIGRPVADLLANPDNPEWRKYSIEFCGGTHVKNTREIGDFILVAEEAVAKGVRRLVGLSGEAAAAARRRGRALEEQLARARRAAPERLAGMTAELQSALAGEAIPLDGRVRLRDGVAALQALVKQHEKQAAASVAGDVLSHAGRLMDSAARHGATAVIVAELPEAPLDALKTLADALKQKAGSAAILLGTRGDKATLLAAVTDDLIKRGVKAGEWIKAVAPLVEGGGGGPPTMAQAGGRNPAKLDEALAAGRTWIEERLR
jgi:alanyl-tRNA synthetase